MSNQISIEDAIRILEVTNIESLKESEIRRIRRRAHNRWHPDKIAHSSPSDETIRRYHENFVRIEPAIDVLRDLLEGNVGARAKTNQHQGDATPTPEEVSRKYATSNQQSLRAVWEKVKQSAFEMSEDDVVVSEGSTIKDMLDRDLEDDIPATALGSFWVGIVLFCVVAIVIWLISLLNDSFPSNLLLDIAALMWLAQAIASFLALLPLSRYWLPERIRSIVAFLVDGTMSLMMKTESTPGAIWIFGLPMILIVATNWLVIKPIYKVLGFFLSKKAFGKISIKVRYYAGFSEEYLGHLMNDDPEGFSQEELFDLAHAASRLARVG